MNVLIVGGGKAGSWMIRGEQLGRAIGARLSAKPSAADLEWADVVVLVKRAWQDWRPGQTKAAVVWDALDFWQQPLQNSLDEVRARTLLSSAMADIQPALVIGATKAMAKACGGVYVPHHCWPGLTPAPARPEVQTVAYQGNAAYLGRWAGWLTEACQKRGWSFVVNPERLTDADILVALRDGPWDGWMCREWKSGVKLVNALAAGRPVITQTSAAYRELLPDGCLVEGPEDLPFALDACESLAQRARIAATARARVQYTLESVAELYRQHLESVACPA